MNTSHSFFRRTLVAAVVAAVCAVPGLFAWGPMTHYVVNDQAFDQARTQMGSNFMLPERLRDMFAGTGPSPDIKAVGGASYPYIFHNDVPTIDRLIELAKRDDRFGLEDVAQALGFAGHVYAEITTAHAQGGYPNNKLTVTIPRPESTNHQLNELAVDLLNYRDHHDALQEGVVYVPVRLLSAAMAAEHQRDAKNSALSPEEVKKIANTFVPTVAGIKVIGDYLIRERPDLLDEMDAFYGDRRAAMNSSVGEVAKMLGAKAGRDFAKSFAGSADGADHVRAKLSGTLKDKVRQLAYNGLAGALKSEGGNDIFTAVAFGVMKGALSNELTRGKFESVALALGSKSIWGDPKYKAIVQRYIEGLLLHKELTLPEIIEYAQQGWDIEPGNLSRQAEQFKALGLVDGGRKPVKVNDVLAAAAEVERIERLQRDWPWFWPLRPNARQLAVAREIAGRKAAQWIIDRGSSSPALIARARAFLQVDRKFRATINDYRQTTFLRPFALYRSHQQMVQATAAFAGEERRFAAMARICAENGGDVPSAARLATLERETTQRLAQVQYVLQQTRAKLAATSKLNFVQRDRLNDQIKELAAQESWLSEQLAAVKALTGTGADPVVATATGTAANLAAAPAANNVTPAIPVPQADPLVTNTNVPVVPLEAAQAMYSAAYTKYAELIKTRDTNDPAVTAALQQLREAEAVRAAAMQKAGRR